MTSITTTKNKQLVNGSISSSNNCCSSNSSTRIRASFLSKLGIEKNVTTAAATGRKSQNSRGSLLGKVQIQKEPLKYDQYDDDVEDAEEEPKHNSPWSALFAGIKSNSNSPSASSEGTGSLSTSPASSTTSTSTSSSTRSQQRQRQRRVISFNDTVNVVPIPQRTEYSNRVKERLWTSGHDLFQNAQRNALEFRSENWDWRSALEDENMYRDLTSGELIHPVHIVPSTSTL